MRQVLDTHRIGDAAAVIVMVDIDTPEGPRDAFSVEVFAPGYDPATDRPSHIGYAADLTDAHRTARALANFAQTVHDIEIAAGWNEWERRRAAA